MQRNKAVRPLSVRPLHCSRFPLFRFREVWLLPLSSSLFSSSFFPFSSFWPLRASLSFCLMGALSSCIPGPHSQESPLSGTPWDTFRPCGRSHSQESPLSGHLSRGCALWGFTLSFMPSGKTSWDRRGPFHRPRGPETSFSCLSLQSSCTARPSSAPTCTGRQSSPTGQWGTVPRP